MPVHELSLRNNLDIESLEVTPNEETNELQFSVRATLSNIDAETLSAIAGSTVELETLTIRTGS